MKRMIVLFVVLFLVSCSVKEQQVQITLEQNASTGYIWQVKQSKQLFRIDKNNIESQSQLVGTPSSVQFTLTSIKSGQCTVKFTYTRPWQSNEEDDWIKYTFEVDSNKQIHVKDKDSQPKQLLEIVDLKIE